MTSMAWMQQNGRFQAEIEVAPGGTLLDIRNVLSHAGIVEMIKRMDNVQFSTEEKVDYYLNKIAMSPQLRLNPRELYEVAILDEETYLIDQVMLEKGLIKIEKENRVVTSKGLEISNFGGWSVYQRLLNRQQQGRLIVKEENLSNYEQEIHGLKLKVAELQKDAIEQAQKEANAFKIITNLLSQKKSDKLLYLLGGIAVGFLLASMISFLIFQ